MRFIIRNWLKPMVEAEKSPDQLCVLAGDLGMLVVQILAHVQGPER